MHVGVPPIAHAHINAGTNTSCTRMITTVTKSAPHALTVMCSKMHKVVKHHEIAETLSVVLCFLLALDILVLGGVFGLGKLSCMIGA